MGSIKPSSGLVAPPQLVPYSFTIFQTPAVGQGPPNDTASFWCSALHLFPLPKSPTQVVCAGDDHRVAVQSDGSAAGSKGSSYSSTEPGIAPMIGMVPLAGGSGDNIATGRPRFVIVTGSRSLPICPITRRHFVLKSVIAIFFTVSPLQRRTGPMSNTRSRCNAGMRKNGCSFEKAASTGKASCAHRQCRPFQGEYHAQYPTETAPGFLRETAADTAVSAHAMLLRRPPG